MNYYVMTKRLSGLMNGISKSEIIYVTIFLFFLIDWEFHRMGVVAFGSRNE